MHRRLRIVALILGLGLAVAPISGADFEIEDRETVYAILDANGKPTELTVVNWLRVYGQGEAVVVDPGDLQGVRNVKGPERPVKVQSGLKWNLKCRNGFKDVFYSGRTTKTLPLEVKIAYYLNGKEVPAAKVGGARGELTVRMTLNNRLRTTEKITYKNARGETVSSQENIIVPLAVNVSTDVPSARFKRIEAPDATCMATGATVKINWIAFPYPTTQLTLKLASDERIRLEPIYFTVVPQMPPLPDLKILGQLQEMTKGMGQLDAGLGEILSGAESLAAGHTRLAAGMGPLRAGIADLRRLNEAHRQIVQRTDEALAGLDLGALEDSLGRMEEMRKGLVKLEEGLASLGQLNEGHRALVASIRAELAGLDLATIERGFKSLDGLAKSSGEAGKHLERAAASAASQANTAKAARARQDELLRKLDVLAQKNPALRNSDEFKELKALAQTQRTELNALLNGGRENGKSYDGLSYSTKVLDTLAKSFKDGQDEIAGLAELNAKSKGVFAAFDRLQAALRVLAEGGSIEGRHIPGLNKAGEGLEQARAGVGTMRAGMEAAGTERGLMAKAREGLRLLREVFRVLIGGGEIQGQQVPGLDTAGEGLAQIHEGLDQIASGIEECGNGSAKLRDGAGSARNQGSQQMYQAMSAACEEMSKAEALQKAAAARVKAYDHFIGKPAGAKGEVRFLLRTEALR